MMSLATVFHSFDIVNSALSMGQKRFRDEFSFRAWGKVLRTDLVVQGMMPSVESLTTTTTTTAALSDHRWGPRAIVQHRRPNVVVANPRVQDSGSQKRIHGLKITASGMGILR